MSDWDQKTIETYDKSAGSLAEYFRGIGARTVDIERAIELRGGRNDYTAIEIGCGDGRDAAEIIPRFGNYIGVDPSIGLLQLARENLPEVSFVQADALSFDYPRTDIIYAFASLLHVPKKDMGLVLQKMHSSLSANGILYVSLKEAPIYKEEPKIDKYGERMFYFYTPEVFSLLADGLFKTVYQDRQQKDDTAWFTIALQKIT